MPHSRHRPFNPALFPVLGIGMTVLANAFWPPLLFAFDFFLFPSIKVLSTPHRYFPTTQSFLLLSLSCLILLSVHSLLDSPHHLRHSLPINCKGYIKYTP